MQANGAEQQLMKFRTAEAADNSYTNGINKYTDGHWEVIIKSAHKYRSTIYPLA